MFSFVTRILNKSNLRSIHVTSVELLKEIVVAEKGKMTVFEGKYIKSPREPFVVAPQDSTDKSCPLCRLGINVKHTDVLILQQFLRSDGCMLPRRITGLCIRQQKNVSSMVSMAQKAGILTLPGKSKDYSKRRKHKKFNTYFDESTIKFY